MSEWPNALAGVCGRWRAARAEERLCSGSEARYSQVFSAFCRYAEANGVGSPRGATADLCRRFIDAPLRGDRRPCTATSCLRLTVLRSAFEVMVSSGDVTANPTIALRVRHETPLRVPAALTPPGDRTTHSGNPCHSLLNTLAFDMCLGASWCGACRDSSRRSGGPGRGRRATQAGCGRRVPYCAGSLPPRRRAGASGGRSA